MITNDDILNEIRKAFPNENFTIQTTAGDNNVLYRDGQKFGVRWGKIVESPFSSNTLLIDSIISNISKVLTGTVTSGLLRKAEEKKEEKAEKFEAAIPEVLEPTVVEAVEPPAIDTTSETPVEPAAAPKKKTSKKKKASGESQE